MFLDSPKGSKLLGGVHKCVHSRYNAVSFTTGGTIQSAVGQEAENSHTKRHEILARFALTKEDLKLNVIILHLIDTSWETGKYV